MGLNAVVFKNVRDLEVRYGAGRFEVDELTGEAIQKLNASAVIPRDAYFAMKRRIGNSAEIASLREMSSKVLVVEGSLILDRILCSGSHSGDSITANEFPQIRKEINWIKAQNCGIELNSFIESMESLLDAAEVARNPIVFV